MASPSAPAQTATPPASPTPDGAGRTLAQKDAENFLSFAAHDPNGNRVATRNPNGLGQDCLFDPLNREIQCVDLQEASENTGRTMTYNAASQLLTQTNAEGHTTTNTYDVRSRLATTTDPNNITTSYGYDKNNNLRTLTDGEGNQRQWFYDARNLNVSKTYPGGGGDTCQYSHDALGRIVDKTDQSNTVHRHIYDLAGRMTKKQYLTGGTTLESEDTFTYDTASRILETNKGRHAITTTHTYAPDSMPLTQTITADGRSYTMSRSYDAGNRATSHTYPDGKATTWSYDQRNLVTDVHYEGQHVISKSHDSGHRLTSATLGNGLTRAITYNRQDNHRTSDIWSDGNQQLNGLAFTYTYAVDKQITSETIAPGGLLTNASFTAQYDAGNHLTNWNRPAYPVGTGAIASQSQTWNFDDAGNWNSTSLDGNLQNRTHNPKDQITNLAGNATTHDTRGNLLTFEHNSKDYDIEYDVENRMTKVEVDSQDVENRYDAFGRRIIRKEGSTKTALLWWDSSECAEYVHGAGQATIQNDIFCHPNRLNAVIARAVDGSKFDLEWYHKNYLDHVYAVSNDSGNLIEHYRYTAYGEQEIYNATGTKIATSFIGNQITWNTRRLDPLTGFYMYKYRHFAPQLGRWPSRDPIGERGGTKLYGFVGNNVFSWIDLFGLRPGDGIDTSLPSPLEDYPCCDGRYGVRRVVDDFGRFCCEDKINSIFIRFKFQNVLKSGDVGHSYLDLPDTVEMVASARTGDKVAIYRHNCWGLYPVEDIEAFSALFYWGAAYVKPARIMEDSHVPSNAYMTFLACPDSVDEVQKRIDRDKYYENIGILRFGLNNIRARNCTGWCFQILHESGVEFTNFCFTQPWLRPSSFE